MRVVSGIQPTGKPHLGNYLGAIVNYVKLQDEAIAAGGKCFIFLADLHALSQPHDPAELARNTREMVATLVACGVDPAKTILFNQAQVPAHAELQWLLNGTARMGWLNRMTQWKDKAGNTREGQSSALFTYPVLQAKIRNSTSNWPAILRRNSTMISALKMRRSSLCPSRIFRRRPRGL